MLTRKSACVVLAGLTATTFLGLIQTGVASANTNSQASVSTVAYQDDDDEGDATLIQDDEDEGDATLIQDDEDEGDATLIQDDEDEGDATLIQDDDEAEVEATGGGAQAGAE
ncbi:hypothetical protein D5S18_14450 [Nocardia panacis]|uniref:DNA primase n=1 Tax=Nocardia panacis TaxID=2340916 RepID=A0A3A4KKN9_9NOCA|nr:hypothetical protein [Nocardia panacis]RJO75622.1 hypothetical protein D5S18_14450 [Nocardia panacis]